MQKESETKELVLKFIKEFIKLSADNEEEAEEMLSNPVLWEVELSLAGSCTAKLKTGGVLNPEKLSPTEATLVGAYGAMKRMQIELEKIKDSASSETKVYNTDTLPMPVEQKKKILRDQIAAHLSKEEYELAAEAQKEYDNLK